jgi:hypothetical protein
LCLLEKVSITIIVVNRLCPSAWGCAVTNKKTFIRPIFFICWIHSHLGHWLTPQGQEAAMADPPGTIPPEVSPYASPCRVSFLLGLVTPIPGPPSGGPSFIPVSGMGRGEVPFTPLADGCPTQWAMVPWGPRQLAAFLPRLHQAFGRLCCRASLRSYRLLGFGPHPPVKVTPFRFPQGLPLSPGFLRQSSTQTCLDHVDGALSAWGKSPFPLLRFLGFDAKVWHG